MGRSIRQSEITRRRQRRQKMLKLRKKYAKARTEGERKFVLSKVVLVAPTVFVAVWICWRSRSERSGFVHALAVVLWILANSTWMIGEFFLADGTRPYAICLFVLGLMVLAFHYLAGWLRGTEP